MLDDFFWGFLLTFFDLYLVVDIFVEKLFLFLLPAVSEVFYQVD